MKSIRNMILAAALGTALFAQADMVDIQPVPRSVVWGDKTFALPGGIDITNPDEADEDAVAALRARFSVAESSGAISVTIGEAGDPAIEPVAALIPQQAQGYYLKVSPEGVIIAGRDGDGTFYGVQTFLQLLAGSELTAVEIKDWPEAAERGVVEGFYGNPWSHQDRLRQFDFYGANKLNFYIYGPKDDPYHKSQWKDPYPTAKGRELTELVNKGHANKVKVVWTMHPGNSISSSADRTAAITKFERMYKLGFRTFGVFFDDISNYSAATQAEFLNYVTDNFVHKHDDVEPLIMCPSEYNRSWAGNGSYLKELGSKTNPEVRVMWTGNSVVDMIDLADVDWVSPLIARDPFIWLNYPVNDYGEHHLLMGPLPANDPKAVAKVSGFTANPMQYAEASKVALYQLADFLWNPEEFNADKSWQRSISAIAPGHEEAFRVFCENNVDLAKSAHGLRLYNESPSFKAVLDAHPSLTADSRALYAAEFAKIVAAGEELIANSDQPELTAEILEFLQEFTYLGQRGEALLAMYDALNARDEEGFVAAYTTYSDLTKKASELLSRGFSGSIQSVVPLTATLYVSPFVRQTAQQLIADYKNSGLSYPDGLFPAQVVEDGTYLIMNNGKYLGNPRAGGIGGNPTFQSSLDNVNPDRQAWRITYQASTGRYKIVNEKDGRYINERGNFTVSDDTNPYEDEWHSYSIYRFNDGFAIQNGGSAGDKFWTVNKLRIEPGSDNKLGYDKMVFNLVSYTGATANHQVESGKSYYILDDKGRYLTNAKPNTTGGNPVFEKITDPNKKSLWVIALDEESGRFSIRSAADNRYINEKGVFGTNPYYSDWNTYELYGCGNTYAIRNGGSAGTKFWTISGNAPAIGGDNINGCYLFKLIDPTISSVESAVADSADIDWSIEGGVLSVRGAGDITSVKLTAADGRVVAAASGDSVNVNSLTPGIYILSVTSSSRPASLKITLP